MVPEEDIDVTKAVVTYGLDSLVAVEFRNPGRRRLVFSFWI